MTVATAPKTKRKIGAYNAADYALGEALRGKLTLMTSISDDNAPVAFATCTLTIAGWRRGRGNDKAPRNTIECPKRLGQGRWACTKMTTLGNLPSINFTGSCGDRATLDKKGRSARRGVRSRVAISHRFEGADDILSAYGLTVEKLLDHYGEIGPDDRHDLTLPQIVRDLCPTMVRKAMRHHPG